MSDIGCLKEVQMDYKKENHLTDAPSPQLKHLSLETGVLKRNGGEILAVMASLRHPRVKLSSPAFIFSVLSNAFRASSASS